MERDRSMERGMDGEREMDGERGMDGEREVDGERGVSLSANPMENNGSVYVYDCNRRLASILRQKMLLSGV